MSLNRTQNVKSNEASWGETGSSQRAACRRQTSPSAAHRRIIPTSEKLSSPFSAPPGSVARRAVGGEKKTKQPIKVTPPAVCLSVLQPKGPDFLHASRLRSPAPSETANYPQTRGLGGPPAAKSGAWCYESFGLLKLTCRQSRTVRPELQKIRSFYDPDVLTRTIKRLQISRKVEICKKKFEPRQKELFALAGRI